MNRGIIHRCLIKHLGCECNMFGFELKEHERLQRLGIDDCIATLLHPSSNGYRHFYSDERLRVAALFDQSVQKRLPHSFFRRCGNVLATKRTI